MDHKKTHPEHIMSSNQVGKVSADSDGTIASAQLLETPRGPLVAGFDIEDIEDIENIFEPSLLGFDQDDDDGRMSVCVETEGGSQRSEHTYTGFHSPAPEGTDTGSCNCSSDVQAGLESHSKEVHVLEEMAEKLPTSWKDIRSELPDAYKWDTTYDTTQGGFEFDQGCWTCTPLPDGELRRIPLTIAKAPVVLPARYRWPPIGGVNPPPDPRPLSPIDCQSELDLDTIEDIFRTFDGSVGFYVLINGLMQVIVRKDFDTAWASSHLPHKFGGLKVCYINNTIEPTMLPTEVTTTRAGSSTSFSSLFHSPKPAQTLQLNDMIEARARKRSIFRERDQYAGRFGLRVAREGGVFLIMSSHVICEAILGKSLDRDKLRGDWNEQVELFAGNSKIGVIEKTYDECADVYPNGFGHDITLVKPSTAASVASVQSPVHGLGWLCQNEWSSIRRKTAPLRILGSTGPHRCAKSVECSLESQVRGIGQGIFRNQNEAAGAKPVGAHDERTWRDFVSRAFLYRVSPDFDKPNGYSGIAVCAEGTREDGTEGLGIVGFQSFVQRHDQDTYDLEGPALETRLKYGAVAFYGAFEVPEDLRKNYTIL
ncbi:hypothetical protein EKO04_002027 [Ascochyta lentis]|uniref:Uncharacterized protein n=1 Tax=Ascochyta lentis TaxID=205686 RepID=A0A8H7MLL2_9PLEO|nr:hypothetical protein EKO04_002027 [Ascochyta lentis]